MDVQSSPASIIPRYLAPPTNVETSYSTTVVSVVTVSMGSRNGGLSFTLSLRPQASTKVILIETATWATATRTSFLAMYTQETFSVLPNGGVDRFTEVATTEVLLVKPSKDSTTTRSTSSSPSGAMSTKTITVGTTPASTSEASFGHHSRHLALATALPVTLTLLIAVLLGLLWHRQRRQNIRAAAQENDSVLQSEWYREEAQSTAMDLQAPDGVAEMAESGNKASLRQELDACSPSSHTATCIEGTKKMEELPESLRLGSKPGPTAIEIEGSQVVKEMPRKQRSTPHPVALSSHLT